LPSGPPNNNPYSKAYQIGAHGDIWINSDFKYDWNLADVGSLQFWSLAHELGHSLGLIHPGDKPNTLIDNQKYSIMSYNPVSGMGVYETIPINLFTTVDLLTDESVLPSGLQLYDIAALQEIYGSRNYATRADDTIYSKATAFASGATNEAFIYTIWDGGGTDTRRNRRRHD